MFQPRNWFGPQRFFASPKKTFGGMTLEVGPNGLLVPTDWVGWEFLEDFNEGYRASGSGVIGWHLDQVEVGATSEAALDADEPYGAVAFGPGATANDNVHYQWANNTTVFEPVTMAAGKRLWLATRFKCADIDKALIKVGLQEAGDDPWGTPVNDRFEIEVLTTGIRFAGNTTAATVGATPVSTTGLIDATYITAQAAYDGVGSVWFRTVSDAGEELSSQRIDFGSSYLPTTPMTIHWGVEGTDTGNDATTLDYVHVLAERYSGAL